MILVGNITQGSEKLWAEHGLTGLVIFALIGVILILLKIITGILKEEREERRYMTEQHVGATGKLSAAIDNLTESFRIHKSDED